MGKERDSFLNHKTEKEHEKEILFCINKTFECFAIRWEIGFSERERERERERDQI